jgi:glycosyltransferase involved in cell wall biosynthesis
MTILFDHQIYIEQEYGGISRYFYELSKGLKIDLKVDVKNTICLSNNIYTTDPIYTSIKFFPNNSFKGKARSLKIVNELNSKCRLKGNFDVFHPTYYDAYFFNNIKNRPFVVTFHDLTHEKLLHKFKILNTDKTLFDRRRLLLEKSAKIIAVSHCTKNDIVDTYKVDPSKIEVVYLANSIDSNNHEIIVPYKNYILYVGMRGFYKNFKLFVAAITPLLLKEKNLKVLCAGGGRFTKEEMVFFKSLRIIDQLIQVDINDQLLATLYKNALFFVFPSLYEGFGIPVLESFSCSCPALLSNTGSLPEIGGGSALYFNPTDKKDILDKVSLLLYDQNLRDKLKVAGLKREQEFSWTETTKGHYKVYKSLL